MVEKLEDNQDYLAGRDQALIANTLFDRLRELEAVSDRRNAMVERQDATGESVGEIPEPLGPNAIVFAKENLAEAVRKGGVYFQRAGLESGTPQTPQSQMSRVA